MSTEEMAYMSRKPCGCLAMATVDSPERKRETARLVAEAIREGEAVLRVTCEEVRQADWWCAEHQAERDARVKQKALL